MFTAIVRVSPPQQTGQFPPPQLCGKALLLIAEYQVREFPNCLANDIARNPAEMRHLFWREALNFTERHRMCPYPFSVVAPRDTLRRNKMINGEFWDKLSFQFCIEHSAIDVVVLTGTESGREPAK